MKSQIEKAMMLSFFCLLSACGSNDSSSSAVGELSSLSPLSDSQIETASGMFSDSFQALSTAVESSQLVLSDSTVALKNSIKQNCSNLMPTDPLTPPFQFAGSAVGAQCPINATVTGSGSASANNGINAQIQLSYQLKDPNAWSSVNISEAIINYSLAASNPSASQGVQSYQESQTYASLNLKHKKYGRVIIELSRKSIMVDASTGSFQITASISSAEFVAVIQFSLKTVGGSFTQSMLINGMPYNPSNPVHHQLKEVILSF